MRLAPRIALAYAAVSFGAPALAGLFSPQFIESSLGLSATNLIGENELRAIYGGLLVGITLFFALAAFRPAWHPAGLAAQLCIFAGMVIARLASIAGSGSPGGSVHLMLATEFLGAVLALLALRAPAHESS